MPQYSMFLRDVPGSFASFGPSEMQAIVARYGAWAEGLKKAGRLVGSHKLRDGQGRVVRRNSGKTMVTDGPYTEGKEVLGGLFIIEAPSYDEALAVANDCPHLDYGTVELREIEIMRRGQ